MTERQVLIDEAAGYRFKPHEMPILPGSPANPDHPGARRAAYLALGIFIGLLGGSQNGFLLANSGAVQAEFALTPVEAGWLTVAFYSTYSCLSMLLFRVRQHFGIQPFVRWAMAGLVAANFVQMIGPGYYPELVARAVAGITAAGLSALTIYYLMQGLPAAMRVGGLVISLGLVQIAFLQGPKTEVNFAPLMTRRLTITGSTLRPQSDLAKARIAEDLHREVWPLLDTGRIGPVMDSDFALADAAAAHARMEAGGHIGKIVLQVAG